MIANTIWIAMAFVKPMANSEFERAGLKGGYGFVACSAHDITDCVAAISAELEEQEMRLSGFEWLSDLSDRESELSEYQQDIVDRLSKYHVQFQEFDWYDGSADEPSGDKNFE